MNDSFDQIIQELENARDKKWTVTSHLRPDGDAIGSLVAMTILLRALGIDATAYMPDLPPAGTENILDLVDATSQRPNPSTHIMALDCARTKALGLELEAADVIINLDHHASNDQYGTINIVDPKAATASMLVWEFARYLENLGTYPKASEALYDPDFQRACYLGIITDTGRFKHSNVDARLMRNCAEILDHGLNIQSMQSQLDFQVPWNIQKRAATTIAEGRFVLGTMLFLVDDVRTMNTDSIDQLKGLVLQHASQTQDLIALFYFRYDDENMLRCSLRCNHEKGWDMNALANEFNGGGHVAASGFEVEISDSKKWELEMNRCVGKIIKHITDTYPQDIGHTADKTA